VLEIYAELDTLSILVSLSSWKSATKTLECSGSKNEYICYLERSAWWSSLQICSESAV